MTVEPSYRIDQQQAEFYLGFDDAHEMVDLGVLVSDTRLQAIADAPRCEHGAIDEHFYMPKGGNASCGDIEVWCAGASELTDLLDALTKEDGE